MLTQLVTLSSSDWGRGTRYFCDARDLNVKCGSYDDVCASGYCVQGKCSDEKLAPEEVCDINNDCQSGACGLQSVNLEAPSVCCTSGSTHSVKFSYG